MEQTVDDLLLDMQQERESKRRPRCIVCDTFPQIAKELIARAFLAGFNRNEIKEKLKTGLGITVSSDSVWNHWNNHARDQSNSR